MSFLVNSTLHLAIPSICTSAFIYRTWEVIPSQVDTNYKEISLPCTDDFIMLISMMHTLLSIIGRIEWCMTDPLCFGSQVARALLSVVQCCSEHESHGCCKQCHNACWASFSLHQTPFPCPYHNSNRCSKP